MKCLLHMNAAQKKRCIFIEQATFFKHKRHCTIECIPVPEDVFDLVPAYFKVLFFVVVIKLN